MAVKIYKAYMNDWAVCRVCTEEGYHMFYSSKYRLMKDAQADAYGKLDARFGVNGWKAQEF